MGSPPDTAANALLGHSADQHERAEIKLGDVVAVLTMGAQGQVLQRTTTDVLLMMRDGSESWHKIENVRREGFTSMAFKVGDRVVLRGTGARAEVLQKTTIDMLLKTADGKETWHEVEDVQEDF